MSKWPYNGIANGGAVAEEDLDMRQRMNDQWERERAALQLHLQQRQCQPPCIVDCAFCRGDESCPQRATSAEDERDPSTPAWRLLGRLIFAASAIVVISLAVVSIQG